MEQNLDVADPWLSRCHDECPVPCCDMSQISVMTAGSWTTCYIFCYITISYTQQHNMSEAHLTHYVYSLNNFKHSTPIHHAWSLRLTGIQRNIVIGRKQWKLWHGEKSMNASGQKSYRVRAVTATPHTTFLLEPPRGTRHRRRVKQISKFYHVLQTAVLRHQDLCFVCTLALNTAFVSSWQLR